MTQQHDWVTGYRDFEAVLHATNALPHWDSAATLRAFQTFGFDDASTPGNGAEYHHAETGIIVRHDGDYVAIEFSNGDLSAALADLVHVLHQLGWTEAEVYHPAETMGALLNDIGMGIPANMAFDVKGAAAVTEISSFAEGASLVGMGRQLLQGLGEEPDMSDLVLGELTSMGAELLGSRDDRPDPPAPGEQVASRPAFALLPEDEAPVVPSLGGNSAAPQAPDSQRPASIPRNVPPEPPDDHPAWRSDLEEEEGAATHAEMAPAAQSEGPVAHLAAPVPEASPVSLAIALPTPASPYPAELETPPSLAASPQRAQAAFSAGNTVFMLAMPGQAVEPEAEAEAGAVYHCWPGAANQDWRWDLIDEFDVASPWFAEALAAELGFDSQADAACFAQGFATFAAAASRGSLRDLLDLLGDASKRGSNFGAMLAALEEGRFVRDAMTRLAGLVLFAKGSSFVEPVRDGRSFSVRASLTVAERRTFVIHRDETDGPFVDMLVRLLFGVASRWARSSRTAAQADVARREAERLEREQSTRQQAKEKATALAVDLRAQLALLKELGVDPEAMTA